MSAVNLTFNVNCTSGHDSNPVYRIYVDDELLAERTWAWPAYEVTIKENVYVEFDEYTKHTLRLENCGAPSNFTFTQVSVNGQAVNRDAVSGRLINHTATSLQEITFTA